jgi:hypothetical protein
MTESTISLELQMTANAGAPVEDGARAVARRGAR